MGINDLLPFVSEYARKISLKDLNGKVCGIDVFGWLYKGTYSCAYELETGQSTTKHIEYVEQRLEQLKTVQIKPVLVFDGITPDLKLPVVTKRRERRSKNRDNALKMLQEGNARQAAALMKSAISIDYKIFVELIKVCVEKGYDYVVSPYESDAQLTYLQKVGLIDYILTEDSDHLLFGCREFTKVIFKVNFDTMDGELIVLNDVYGSTASDKFYSFTVNMFRCMCILSGCDYLPSIIGVGIKRAYAAVRQKPDPNDAIEFLKDKHHLTVPDNYQDNFQLAMSTILAHPVFDPSQLTQVPLYEVENNQVAATFIHLDGIKLLNFSRGNVDPRNLDQLAYQFSLDKPSIDTYAIRLFKLHALDTNNDEHRPNENNRENDQEIAPNTVQQKNPIDHIDDTTEHCLPFKVLGSAHHRKMQDSLELGLLAMNEGKQVQVHLQPEPTNDYDSNAILVEINYGGGFKPVGYIARELTRLLNPLLGNQIVSVGIKHIKFRTTFQNIGYYITIIITKKGPWDNSIVKKSKSVK